MDNDQDLSIALYHVGSKVTLQGVKVSWVKTNLRAGIRHNVMSRILPSPVQQVHPPPTPYEVTKVIYWQNHMMCFPDLGGIDMLYTGFVYELSNGEKHIEGSLKKYDN